ncbi:unnamed protein product [Larinioides sclopetarius]|uniref:Uncharacterized protein n=1 Tax=Larinioides sclopetarius TaxID=280406 RepID=A0AAV1ZJL8_9ARAC
MSLFLKNAPLPETQQAAPIPADQQHLSFLLSPEDVPVLDETLQSRQGAEPSLGDMTIQGTSPVIQPRTSMDDFQSFILGPVPVPGQRRPRRRHLVIDPVTSMSSEQLRTQLSRVDTHTVPAYLRRASLGELTESMFRRLSNQLVPSGIRNRLQRLQTLQQPTDLFPYVVSLSDESSSPDGAEMLREEEEEHAPSVPQISETFPSMEMLRDATASTTDPSASGLLRTSSLRVCEISPVSPERTPPPSSAESMTPALEETHLLVLQTLERSDLHTRGLVYLEQPVADGDIFIKLCD